MQAKGSVHDFNLFKNSYTGFSKRIKVQADSGYQGIKNIHENSETSKKASKLHPLTKEEKVENTRISKERIFIEHINYHIKDLRYYPIDIEIKEKTWVKNVINMLPL